MIALYLLLNYWSWRVEIWNIGRGGADLVKCEKDLAAGQS